jgi:spermidine synthase
VRQLNFFQKLLSYFFPIRVAGIADAANNYLELYRYAGRWQLATDDALYSDGKVYRPLRIAFKKLGKKLSGVNTVLLLGGGLGSGIDIMLDMGYKPHFTVIEADKQIMKWALELNAATWGNNVTAICADAEQFIADATVNYDMVVVDIFKGRHVMPFVETPQFLHHCSTALKPGGLFVLNYIINSEADWQAMQGLLNIIFPNCQILEHGENRLILAY